jgi:hypothetical protein
MRNEITLRYEYFDWLIRKLDLIVETLMSESFADNKLIAKYNDYRSAFIKEIHKAQALNERVLSNRNNSHKEEVKIDDLFPHFCFFINESPKKGMNEFTCENSVAKDIGLRLVVTDKYLTKAQVECFENLFYYSMQSLELYGKSELDLNHELFFVKTQEKVMFKTYSTNFIQLF